MPNATPSLGARRVGGYAAVTALVATGLAIPVVAGSASAACNEGVRFQISNHDREFRTVKGTKITFTKPGTHTVEITKKGRLVAKYGTNIENDQEAILEAILEAVQDDFPKVRDSVTVTKGHKVKFSSDDDERVTVRYGSRGDSVTWKKVDVDDDCDKTVLDKGTATFPRNNLDWLFAVSVS